MKIMKINLKKLKQLEMLYRESSISLNALHDMIEIVLRNSGGNFNGSIAINTLIDLGVLEKEKTVQQLNS